MLHPAHVALATSLALIPCATAQVALYDAGHASSVPSPESPEDQGWTLVRSHPTLGFVGLTPLPNDDATGRNAWGILDTTAPAFARYHRTLPHIPDRFELSVTMSLPAGDASFSMFLRMQHGLTLGDHDWRVGFGVDGSDVLLTLYDAMSQTFSIRCEGGAVGYHTYALRQTPAVAGTSAFVLFDGDIVGTAVSLIPDFSFGDAIAFGTTNGVARASIHRVELRGLDGAFGTTASCGPLVPNSTGSIASLTAFGSPDVNGPGFSLEAAHLPPNTYGYFLMSFGTASIPLAGSQGTLCLDPISISRAAGPNGPFHSGPPGSFLLDLDPQSMPTQPMGPVGAGTLYFQAWFRDANPTPTSNLSDLLAVTLVD